ncbi:T9SS C-terminal target domain-containing protein [Polaribacter sp. WD7]|uniref:glycoside hydrolase family 9 protein n=1 Tax=Polaribacter sp. WD7 TaxID=2269061 RepID=UPI000DF27997|nr:glycoside hydrolase family 9 protein [Polaribacter sp. WD7]RCS26620.1 T9SS C-terminal target domain-containing protein [Polaribacter sp. WD7]
MYKLKIVSVFLFLVINTFSQTPIFVEDFNDSNVNSISTPTGFSSAISNGTLQIIGNGNGGLWSSISYNVNNGIDLSESPKLFIRAKSSPSVEMRVDLRDDTGYLTNQNPISARLSGEFVTYEFDFTDKLFDGAFGGPCKLGPCAVDATNIKTISIYANPGIGKYNGTIELDWISFGYVESSDQQETTNFQIRYNQVGYLIGRAKTISITSPVNFLPLTYSIKNKSGVTVKTGQTPNPNFWGDAQEYASIIDFSEIETAGEYTIEVNDKKQTFTIGNDVYDDLSLAALKYFYYNRASTAITAQYGGIWARTSGLPDTQVRVHSSAASTARPTGTIISAPKGWFDAGDYNKYIVNSGISTYTLLAAFEHYTSYYASKNLNIPESGNNLPDILDEIIWNLDWMLAMQDPNDGGVYHKLTGLNFAGRIMPNRYTATRYVVRKSTSAALNFAAVTAMASRIFKQYEVQKPGYSTALQEAAKEAYAWAKANPTNYFTNPTGVRTGEYGDRNVTDEFQWAATELFITTKEAQFKNDININNINNGVPSWHSVGGLALFSMNHHSAQLSADINVTIAQSKVLEKANEIRAKVNTSPMEIGMANSDYVWGSNSVAANQMMYLIRAYEISKEETYLKAAYKTMDYLLGRNGTGFSFVSGFGDKTPIRPHHRISDADGIAAPIPGMLAGGPQPGQQDKCTTYPSNAAARSFSDTWCSYSTNEVTINWNAPLAYVTNALRFYQNSGVALSVSENNSFQDQIQLYPNPVSNLLHINLTNQDVQEISIYSIAGKQVFKTKAIERNITLDFSDLQTGVYIVKIKKQDKIITKKVIKN